MALEARLAQRQVQRLGLVITPQLRQAIKILQLPRGELETLIHEELDQNPLLAVEAGEEVAAPPEEAPPVSDEPAATSSTEEIDWRAYLEDYQEDMPALPPTGADDEDDERYNLVENQPNRTESLSEYLAAQLRFNTLTAEEEQIASLIIGNLNADGYLQDPIEDLAASAGVAVAVVERVLTLIQACDPPGVAARDVRECLLLQLRDQEAGRQASADPTLLLAMTIVQDHLTMLEGRRFDRLAKELGVTVEEVTGAVKLISSLDPKPGRNFDAGDVHYVEPDVYVHKIGEDYVVTLNEDGLPRLKVSASYRRLLTEEGEAKSYVQEKLRAATWLIKSIHQRQRTLLSVTQSIIKFQRDFLTHGVSQMRPLVLRDVAEDVGLHESTVSRAVADKYIATARGIYPLKKFFTTGLKGPQGQDVAAESVKERIRELIGNEDPARPLSDEDIAHMLSGDNVIIARRTVAKYRESMNILPSAKRKRLH